MIRTAAHETVYNLVKAAHDPYDAEKLDEIRDKYGADLYKWALAEIQREQDETTEQLWYAACSGETETLRSYYNGGGKIGRKYTRFGKNHSLVAGAYRNGYFETARYLLQVGEKLEKHETDIDLTALYIDEVIKAAENLVDYFKFHNKNTTKAQDGKISNLENALDKLSGKYEQ